jgi:hypothetical protein
MFLRECGRYRSAPLPEQRALILKKIVFTMLRNVERRPIDEYKQIQKIA